MPKNLQLDANISMGRQIKLMSPEDRKKLAGLLLAGGSEALIPELEKLKGAPADELGDLAVFLAPLGGTKWPSLLHSLGANLDFVDDEGQTALSQCVQAQSDLRLGQGGTDTFATAAELLDLGADPNASYLSMSSVTALAARLNLPDFVVLFLLAGADLHREEPDS